MSVGSEISSISYLGNNSTAVGYEIPFGFFDPAHIHVSVKDAADVVTILPASLYQVNVPSSEVTTSVAYPNTSEVTIYRQVPIIQETEYTPYGPFPAETTEDAFDYRTHVDQQLARVLGTTVRAPWEIDPIQPEANGVMGWDANGQPITYDQAYIRELVQMAGGDEGMGTRTFANAAARGGAVPDFLGQWGVQRDDNSTWIATALTAGAWIKAPGNSDVISNVIVTNDADLKAALLLGGRIGICGTINLSASTIPTGAITGINLTMPGTELYSICDGAGNRGKLVFQHVAGTSRNVIDIRTQRCKIIGIEITTNHPLINKHADSDVGIRMYGAAGPWATDFVIQDCYIHDVAYGIYQVAGASASISYRGRIVNNHIASFCWYGISFNYNQNNLLIEGNYIEGREDGDVTYSATGDAATDTVTANAHGHVAGEAVFFKDLTGAANELYANRGIYFISGGTKLTANTYQLSVEAYTYFSTTTNGSPIVTGIVQGTGMLAPGWIVHGPGIPVGTTILSVNSGTQVTLSANATANATNVLLVYSKPPVGFSTNFTATVGHAARGNAVFVSNAVNYTTILKNKCFHIDRHGIEVFNGGSGTVGSNFGTRVGFNVCEDCQFGITITGSSSIVIIGNQIERARGIGIELPNLADNTAKLTVVGNSILDTRFDVVGTIPNMAISIDGVANSLLFANNQVGYVEPNPFASNKAYGIQIYSQTVNIKDINIRGNVFTDSGNWMIFANPGGSATHTRYIIENNTFLYTTAYDGLYGASPIGWPAVVIWDVTLAVVRNNTVWYPIAAGKLFGNYTIVGTCAVYTGDSTAVPETTGDFTGSNLRIGY